MILQPTIAGKKLPALTNPGSAADLLAGKQLIDADGNVLTGTMPTQGAQTITPGTAAKTIAAGRYLTGAQTIQGDADLKAANIKSGVNIFGVAGTYGFKITAERKGTSSVSVLSGSTGKYISFSVKFTNEPKVLLGYYVSISLKDASAGYSGGSINIKATSFEYLISEEAKSEWYGTELMHNFWSSSAIVTATDGPHGIGSLYPSSKNGDVVWFFNYLSSYSVNQPTYASVYAIYTY